MCGLTPLGIIEEPFQHHAPYIAACRELGVSHRVVRITGDDWVSAVRESGCDAFLNWPSMGRRALREMFDTRLRIMEREMGLRLYPSYGETWMYEDKYRLADWLEATGLPHPKTRRFFRKRDAMAYTDGASLPVVVKTRLGAASSGVWIVRTRGRLRRLVRKAFGRGLLADFRHVSEAERGSILIQDHVRIAREWRMVRVGDSFFGHVKGRRGEKHSGSGRVEWDVPSDRHLDFLKHVIDVGGFRSMAVDVLETVEGELLVNELQTVFSARASVDQMKVDGVAGRMVRRPDTAVDTGDGIPDTRGRGEEKGERRTSDVEHRTTKAEVSEKASWIFEPGDFARNACCNARVEDLLSLLRGKDAGR